MANKTATPKKLSRQVIRSVEQAFGEADKPSGSQTIGLDVLANAALFTFTFHRWGNRRKADTTPEGAIDDEDKAKKRVRSTLRLIESEAYDTINSYINEARQWLLGRCMPSYMVKGVFFVKLDQVETFEAKIAEVKEWMSKTGLPDLLSDYERAIDQAEVDLRAVSRTLRSAELFNRADYPKPNDLRSRYYVTHNWMSFGVPQNLPLKIREQEETKIKAKFEDAAAEITEALRAAFNELLTTATARLTANPNGKKMIIRSALVDNFNEFIETFNARNLTDDRQLEQLVEQARALMKGVSAETLRTRPTVRRSVAAQLLNLQAAAKELVIERPDRKFDFDDEE